MKQEKNQKRYDYIVCIIFMCLIILPSVIWGGIKAMAHFYPEINEAVDYDIGENRKKAEFPTKFNINTITTELEQYYNDRLPFRASIITAHKTIMDNTENVYKDNIRPMLISFLYKQDDSKKNQAYLPPNILNEKVIEGRNGWLFYYDENNIDYYLSNNIMSDDEMDKFASYLRKLSDLCEEKGIKFQMIIAPNKEQVYEEYMPSYKVENEYKRVQKFVDYVKEKEDINVLYPIDELREAKLYGHVYYMYDTHWNELGAFVGIQELYKALGMSYISIDECTYSIGKKSEGDLISLGALSSSKYNKDKGYDVVYRENIVYNEKIHEYYDEEQVKYSYQSTESNAMESEKMVLIGDSFSKAMIPYLAKDFAQCSFIHRSNVEKKIIKEEIKSAEILVLETVERYDEAALWTVKNLIDILSE